LIGFVDSDDQGVDGVFLHNSSPAEGIEQSA
jgi:hypothetical protein